ncbi:glycoside hydrolase family 127 protein [candidate division KSB1 bacterium]|nr:glycoside hydrolase family 127 protein [candidate division KSB1 bacterium]
MSTSTILVQKCKMNPLPLGSIRPTGWLRNQLQIQADGLSGHLDEFWPDIQHSAWFGGEAEGWERAPYWLDGVVPLAFLLDDAALKEKVTRYIDYVLTHQDEAGWLGPIGEKQDYDIWAIFLALKPLIQFYDATGDVRVPAAIEKCLRRIEAHIDRYPISRWAQFRWFEALIAIYWLYEIKPEKWLTDLAVKLQAQGFDWEDFFELWPLKEPTQKGKWTFMGHVVNNGMAIKSPALRWRLTGDEGFRQAVYRMIRLQDEFHGMVTGIFTGDECLAGKNPSQGTELCAVVEYMYSLEILLAIMGDPAFGDRLEKVTFNALPATFSPDMWAHQYDQQVNQVECSIKENRIWTTNGPESNIYGLEPNFGCCTANLSQGWPKFAAHLWYRTEDDGLAAAAYAPCTIETQMHEVPVKIEVITDYPFREVIRLKITAAKPVRFPLRLRLPGWAERASIFIAGEKPIAPPAGEFYKIEREWNDTTEVKLTFPMQPRASRRYHKALAIERGPLVYALKIGEEWKRVNEDKPHRELPHADWEVYPTTPWNYALDLSDKDIAKQLKFEEHPIGAQPFSPESAPVSVQVKGKRVHAWKLVDGSADELPQSPINIPGDLETLTLIPYGCTNLRIAEFPTLK